MAHDVFISYAQRDKPTADAVCHGLESAGIRCWIAPRDVPAGSNWKTQLVEAIRHARLMLLVFSSEADRSPQVMREVDIAFESGSPIVPFRIEDVKMSDEMYYCIAARHWLDALNPPLEEHIGRLTADVRAILAVRPPAAGTAGASVADPGVVPSPVRPEPAPDSPQQDSPQQDSPQQDWPQQDSPQQSSPMRPGQVQDAPLQASRPASAPPPVQPVPNRVPDVVPPAGAGAPATTRRRSFVRGWTVGLTVLVAVVLVAGTLALRRLVGPSDALLVVAIVAGAFFLAIGRRRH